MALNRLSKRPGEVSSAQKLLPEETKDSKQLSDRELFKMMGYEGGKQSLLLSPRFQDPNLPIRASSNLNVNSKPSLRQASLTPKVRAESDVSSAFSINKNSNAKRRSAALANDPDDDGLSVDLSVEEDKGQNMTEHERFEMLAGKHRF